MKKVKSSFKYNEKEDTDGGVPSSSRFTNIRNITNR